MLQHELEIKSEDIHSESRKDAVAQIIGIRWSSPSETLPNGHPVHHLHRPLHPVHHRNGPLSARTMTSNRSTNGRSTNNLEPPPCNAQIEELIVADGLHSIHCRLLHNAPHHGQFALNKMVNLKQFAVQTDAARNGIYLVVSECSIYSVLPELPSVYGTYCKDINAEYEVQQLLQEQRDRNKVQCQSTMDMVHSNNMMMLGTATGTVPGTVPGNGNMSMDCKMTQNGNVPNGNVPRPFSGCIPGTEPGNDRKRRFNMTSTPTTTPRDLKRVRTVDSSHSNGHCSTHSMANSSSSETTVSEVPTSNMSNVQSLQSVPSRTAVATAQIESFDHILKDFVIQNNHRFHSTKSNDYPSMNSMASNSMPSIQMNSMNSMNSMRSNGSNGTNSPSSPRTPVSVSPALHRGPRQDGGGQGLGSGSGRMDRMSSYGNGQNGYDFGGPFGGKQMTGNNGTWSSQSGLSKVSESLDYSRKATMRMFKEFDACYSSFTMASGWQPQ